MHDAPHAALPEDVSASPYYNEDLAPTRPEQRTWSAGHLASLWIGMAVCIPTYMLGAGLIASGMSWLEAMITILLGNVIVLVPMVLNGHPGTKYGIPFPVLVRSSFGLRGSNIPGLLRAAVACGWFGIQTWIGGHALYVLAGIIWPGLDAAAPLPVLDITIWQLAAFLLFWLMNVYFILRGTESIKHLEAASAPILILMGIALLWVMSNRAGGLRPALEYSSQFARPSVELIRVAPDEIEARFAPLSENGQPRAMNLAFAETREGVADAVALPLPTSLRLKLGEVGQGASTEPELIQESRGGEAEALVGEGSMSIPSDTTRLYFQFSGPNGKSSILERAVPEMRAGPPAAPSRILLFFASLTAMVGFWATLSLNIPDFTRFAKDQKTQVIGQSVGLPTTMALYSFIGIAVTCAAVAAFRDILIIEDAPWDPVNLLKRAEFQNWLVVAVSMIGLTIATLTTNIAANVVSPANDFSNLAPRLISFRMGGIITAVIGIVMMPWKLIQSTQGYIFTWLIGYGALLGPVGGIMIADYWIVRRRELPLEGLYRPTGEVPEGVSWRALVALVLGVLPNVPGFLAASFPDRFASAVPELFQHVYTYAWFVGFFLSFAIYIVISGRAERPAK